MRQTAQSAAERHAAAHDVEQRAVAGPGMNRSHVKLGRRRSTHRPRSQQNLPPPPAAPHDATQSFSVAHVPKHALGSIGATHAPPRHSRPAAHGALHPPQFAASVCVFVQRPPQVTSRAAQRHVALAQCVPIAHADPQLPQLASSVVRATSQPLAALPSQSA
ncbi:MAG: hypothetical protein JWM10_5482 [Myxococcaceae bacterium]|nr:hypothetical protein [Myxococcaceae bacterium]